MLADKLLLMASKFLAQPVENGCALMTLGKAFPTTDFSYPVVMCLANFRHACEHCG